MKPQINTDEIKDKESDSYFMQKAIILAKLGMNMTSPNPRVGCVIVKNGKVIGEGYHKKFGAAHAEIETLNSVSESPEGATVYVTLEPCSHYGKTPPCVERIVEEGIKKVVISVCDPNPVMEGLKILKNKGIKTITGVLEKEGREIIKNYIKFINCKKPYITAKAAVSWDGKIATKTGESRWISSDKSRNFTMTLRGENDAILVGAGTVNSDNPELTYRLNKPSAKQPLRIVIDGNFSIDLNAKIVSPNTLIITRNGCDFKKKKEIEKKGAEVVELEEKNGIIPPEMIVNYLYRKKITSLLIEGGGETIGKFLDAGELDRMVFIFAPILIGGKDAPTACDGRGVAKLRDSVKLKNIKIFNLGDNTIMQCDLKCSQE